MEQRGFHYKGDKEMKMVAELQMKLTLERLDNSSLFKAAETLFKECRDRHCFCRGCKSQKECCSRWTQLVNHNDAFSLPMHEYNVFRRDLRRLEEAGYLKG